LLKQIDVLVRKVRSNKQLSFKQKNESIEELGFIKVSCYHFLILLGQAFNISSNEGCTTITSQAKFFRIKLFVGNLLKCTVNFSIFNTLNFADNLSKNGLKTHISTLRKDRAESLHKVTSELEQLNKGVIDLNKLLVGCAYLKRNNKLDSVLNKQTGHNGLNADIKLDFDFSKGYLELSVKGVKNREVNSALQQIALVFLE
jgi:hypothetical protein